MTIRVALRHVTSYTYDQLVQLGPQVVRLRPAPHCRTPVSGYSMRIEPKEHFLNWQQDPLGNWQGRLVFPKPSKQFKITIDLVAEMTVINPFDFFLEEEAEEFPFVYDEVLKLELAPYLALEPAGPLLTKWLTGVDMRKRRTVDFLVDLNSRLYKDISYTIRMEPGVQSPEETLTKASGSCRDSGWLLVQACRNLGLAARFVSGYLIQLTADVASLDGPSGPKEDFTDLHAWCEVYLPGAGWVGLDPTSGLMAGEGHLPLACSADPITAAPIAGGFTPLEGDEADCEFDVKMSVTRVLETPRQTKPYSDEQWDAIRAMGNTVDRDLRMHDVRLTVGGEPTFVSIDDPDGAEWTTGALGERKRRLAGHLVRKLRDRFSNGGFLHFGQGKWYPGEQLPRWALGCFWRADGLPIWRDHELVAPDHVNLGHDSKTAEIFVNRLASRLGVHDRWIMPAYEDAFYYLWKERTLPVNVDPYKSNLEDKMERARLAKVFSQGLDHVIGYTMPLRRHPFDSGWQSGPWFLRDERLRLLPGDSSMGYRLPLDSLPWHGELPDDSRTEPDPLAPRKPLPVVRPRFQSRGSSSESSVTPPKPGEPYGPTVRTALCVEPRDGSLKVFLPPVFHAEDYLDLIAALEDTAAELGTPIQVEGYKPPHDPRIKSFAVTPDPGVIEVNIQPAGSWQELTAITETVYEEAHLARLAAEKFMLDGRHTGTGGGNHITMGGSTPADSPFLRRPDLLRSLIGYWHNHPSLSYLFSGMFIGPTSQAPRADEARSETTYELQMGLNQLPDRTPVQPWLVDRVMRHLLTDLTGNTHRAEFCIDKLYSPDHATGRLGLLEMRGFEMPPHPRMAMAQHLLMRSLVARFWRQPYQQRLARWGTELHDRWMLPGVINDDFNEVLSELGEIGYALDPAWFAPHHEFRFPMHGQLTYRGLTVEVRQALEPWHVLGEESGAGGTARYVDSSLERVQVKIHGATDSRHVVTCNGRLLPLHPTGTRTEALAGVRFRAWQPPSCLHPTIGTHVPLVFDVIDTWNNRAVAGCTYHVAHPGGRNSEIFPVNANEAESRRAARFQHFGHTPGPVKIPTLVIDQDYPYTLDLRS